LTCHDDEALLQRTLSSTHRHGRTDGLNICLFD